jgi:hypothetical protein
MKPQDILIALKILANPDTPFRQMDLALSLHLSISEISRALNRLASQHLYIKANKTIAVPQFLYFIEHAAPFIFRLNRTGPTSGNPLFQSQWVQQNRYNPPIQWGWEGHHGTQNLHGYSPFHKSVPKACAKDSAFRRMVLLFEHSLITEGDERNRALVQLRKWIESNSKFMSSSAPKNTEGSSGIAQRKIRPPKAEMEPVASGRESFNR